MVILSTKILRNCWVSIYGTPTGLLSKMSSETVESAISLLLKHLGNYRILLSKSQILAIKVQKAEALKRLAADMKKEKEAPVGATKLSKKIGNLKTRVKAKRDVNKTLKKDEAFALGIQIVDASQPQGSVSAGLPFSNAAAASTSERFSTQKRRKTWKKKVKRKVEDGRPKRREKDHNIKPD